MLVGDVMGEAQDHVRLTAHLALLVPRQVSRGVDHLLALLAPWSHPVRDAPVLLSEHHPPAEPHPLLVPQDAAVVEVRAEREQDLQGGVEGDRREAERAEGPAPGGRGWAGARCEPSKETPGPVGLEEERCGGRHQEREDADGEEQVRSRVEEEEHGERVGTRAPVHQERHREEVVQEARPAHQVGGLGNREERADDGQLRACGEPYAEGLRVEEPVGLGLGEPGVEVDDADLKAHQVEHPRRHLGAAQLGLAQRIEGEGAPQRHEAEEEREEADQIVVVQVVRDVDELHVGEQNEERRRRDAIEEPEGEEERRHRQRQVDHEHRLGGRDGDPLEAPVRKEVVRSREEALDPAVREEAERRDEENGPEDDAEDRQRRDVARGVQSLSQALHQSLSPAARFGASRSRTVRSIVFRWSVTRLIAS